MIATSAILSSIRLDVRLTQLQRQLPYVVICTVQTCVMSCFFYHCPCFKCIQCYTKSLSSFCLRPSAHDQSAIVSMRFPHSEILSYHHNSTIKTPSCKTYIRPFYPSPFSFVQSTRIFYFCRTPAQSAKMLYTFFKFHKFITLIHVLKFSKV